MKKIEADLHMHSIYSDGTLYPQEILNLAIKKGLKIISITDHDHVGPYIKDKRVITGVEIEAEQVIDGYKIKGLEILGYNFNVNKLRQKIEPVRKTKMDNIRKSINNFNKFNFESNLFTLKNQKRITMRDFFISKFRRELTQEEFNTLIKHCCLTKLKLAEYLCNNFFEFNSELKKIYGDIYLLFKKEFSDTIFKRTERKKPTFKKTINLIKDCGGIPVIAHPAVGRFFIKKWFNLKSSGIDPAYFISLLKEYGLEGVELYNYSGVMRFSEYSTSLINKYFKELSKKLNLINIWGSDYHGNQWWNSKLGTFGATIEEIKPFLKRTLYKN